MENLFDSPTTLHEPKHFVGRKDELERIFGLIKNKQNVSLVGPRRIGKTSLLTCLRSPEIQQEYHFDGSRFLFLYLDLQKRSMKKEEVDFFDHICRVLKEQAQSLGCIVDNGLKEADLFDALLDEFQRLGLYPVLMMDAFDEIGKYVPPIDEETFSFLRAGGSGGKLSYITASMDTPFEILRKILSKQADSSSSPFYNIFAIIRLKPLSLADAQKLLVETSSSGGRPFSENEVAWVIQQAGTHPYLLQQVAALLFEAKRSREVRKVDYKSIQEEAQQNLFSHFEDSWAMLTTTSRQSLLQAIALLMPNLADRQSFSKDHNLDEEDEESQENHANFTCPEFYGSELFYIYLRDTGKLIESPLSKLTTDDFKDILADLNDHGRLGQSELVKVAFIAAQIEKQQAMTSALRGKIVQDILKEALANMKGQGERIDQARGWIHYNILYYRYFMLRHNMSQNDVAGRLGFSERQYYRHFSQALQRFKNVLQEMDSAEALKHKD